MKKYFIIATLALAALTTACEKQWDNVPKKELATKEAIQEEGYTFISVNQLKKDYFYKELPEPGKTIKGVTINDKVALETVVVSSDELGNTYRSLYVQDVNSVGGKDVTGGDPNGGGIEIKVGKGSMYTVYKPGQKLYIKCDELILGNYRSMLGLGGPSSDASYSNGFIDIQTIIDEKILPGEMVGADTLVVNKDNVKKVMDNYKDYLGRLCRFEGVESTWGSVKAGAYSNTYPSFMDSGDEATKKVYRCKDCHNESPTWFDQCSNPDCGALDTCYEDNVQVDDADDYNKDFRDYNLPVTWAYSYDNLFFYGSAAFLLKEEGLDSPSQPKKDYPFIVRTSGYSRFALEEVPADGEICDITAVLTIYDSTFQLVLNNHEDVVVK